MDFRAAKPDDADAIRTVARESLHASYDDILGEEPVENAVSNWYGEEELAEKLDNDELLLGVIEVDDEIGGFSQSYLREEEGRIQWLHVSPDHRGKGVGTALLEHTRKELANRGVSRITGVVLAENEDGNEFYSDHEFSLEDQVTVSIGGEFHAENVYHDVAGQERTLEPIDTPDGESTPSTAVTTVRAAGAGTATRAARPTTRWTRSAGSSATTARTSAKPIAGTPPISDHRLKSTSANSPGLFPLKRAPSHRNQ